MSNRRYTRGDDTYDDFEDSTKVKPIKFDNWAAFNYNKNSKMIKHYCDKSCERHPDYDKRRLIRYAFDNGYKRCAVCGYFKTTKIHCPCCNQKMRGKMRQKNKPGRPKREFKEY